jgi:Ca-dependent carbohydrate-binding module xylan-binding/Right handed beta helix region
MASIAHSDWMFEHSLVHHFDTPVDFHPDTSADISHVTQTDSVASVLQTLWHHTDLMNGGSSPAQSASNASAAVGSGKGILPTLTVANTAITVNAGGSIALPITASPGSGHDASVTISGLTSYESLTDSLDHKIFTGDSITLSAAEVNSGLSLASDYTGTGHPVNTLTVTASDTLGHHTLTSAPQTIVVTDPPVSTSSSGGATTNGLTLQVSGDNLHGTDPQIEVFVDGTQIGGTYTITADHASGQTQTLQIAGNFDPTVAHQVQVKFVNDAWDGQSGDGNDINAYVESISLNGTSIAGAQGTNNATNGAVNAANANEAVMDIDGTLTFNVPGTGGGTSTSGSGTSTGGSGGSGTATVGTGAGAPPSGAGFFVSPTGSDSNPGTLAAPFATLSHAQQAMENSSIKVTYVEGGTYHLTSALDLTAADNGETWQYYPPNGVDSAVLDGGSATDLILLDGSSNVTINGLSLQHASSSAIATQDGAGAPQITGITIENCDIGFNQHTGAEGGFNPLVFIENATNTHIENNYVHDGASQGIGLFAFYSGQSIDGDVVSGNVVLNTVQQMSDGGAIYLSMRGTGGSGGHVTVTDNFVRDYGASGITGAAGIYLDDNTSNVTVTGNVIAPPTEGDVSTGNLGATALEIHDGLNNQISGNIIDLGDSGRTLAATWFQDGGSLAGMSGNTFTGNVVISGFTGNQNTNFSGQTGFTFFENSPSSDFTIANNLYFNDAGGQVRTDGPTTSDSNPILGNPEISGPTYQIASGSPVFGSPVNFASIVGGWGPPGFVIPQTGTVSSDQ